MTTPKTVLTNAGRAKITNAITLGTPLSLVKIALGSSEITPVATMTTVPNQVWIGNLDSLTVDPTDANLMVARITVPAEAGPFFVRSAGLIDSAGTLIAIASLATMEQVPGGTTLKVSLVISVGADSVSGITLVPAGSFIGTAEKGQPGGVATLDGSGKVPASQLPESPGVGGGMNSANWPLDTETVEPIACAYPLNAEESEILMLNGAGQVATGRATLGGEQSASYITQGELAEEEKYWAAPADFIAGTSAKIDLSSGKKAIQIRLNYDEMDLDTATGDAEIQFALANPSFVPIAAVALGFMDGVVGFNLEITNYAAVAFYVEDAATRTEVITLEFDCDEGTITVRRNGEMVSVGIAATFTPGLAVAAVTFTEGDGLNVENAGKGMSVEWRTQFSDIEGDVSEGYTDVCGNDASGGVVVLPGVEAPALLTVTGTTPSVYQGNTYCAADSEDYDPSTMFSEALLWDSSLVIPFKRKPGSGAAFSPVNWPMTLTVGTAVFTASDAMYGGTYPNNAVILDDGETVAVNGSGIQVAIGQLGDAMPTDVRWFAFSIGEVPEEAAFAQSGVNFSTAPDPITPPALGLSLTTGGLKYKLAAGSDVTFDAGFMANDKVLVLLGGAGDGGTIFVGTEASIAASEGALTPLLSDFDFSTLHIYGVLLSMMGSAPAFPYAITVTTDSADLSPAMQAITGSIDGFESSAIAMPEATPVALLKITAAEETPYGSDKLRAGDYAWYLAPGDIRKIYSGADLQALAAAEVIDGLTYPIPLLNAEGMAVNSGYNSTGLPVFSVTPIDTIIKTSAPTTLHQGMNLYRFVPTGSLVRRGEDYWELFVSSLEADSAYPPTGSIYDGYVPFPPRAVRPSVAGDAMTPYIESLGGATGLYEFISNGNGGGSFGAGAGVRSESGDLAYVTSDIGGLYRGHIESGEFITDETLLDADAFPPFVTGDVFTVFLEGADVKCYRNGSIAGEYSASVDNFSGWRGFLGQFDGRGWNSNVRKFFFNAGMNPYQWVPRAHGYAPVSYLYRALAAENLSVPTKEEFDALFQSIGGLGGVDWPLTQAGEWIGYPLSSHGQSGVNAESHQMEENDQLLTWQAENIASGYRGAFAEPSPSEGQFSIGDNFQFEVEIIPPDDVTYINDYFHQVINVDGPLDTMCIRLRISAGPSYRLHIFSDSESTMFLQDFSSAGDLPARIGFAYEKATHTPYLKFDGVPQDWNGVDGPEQTINFGTTIERIQFQMEQHNSLVSGSPAATMQLFSKLDDMLYPNDFDAMPTHRGGPIITILPDGVTAPALLHVTSEEPYPYGLNTYGPEGDGVFENALLLKDGVTVVPLPKVPAGSSAGGGDSGDFSGLYRIDESGVTEEGIKEIDVIATSYSVIDLTQNSTIYPTWAGDIPGGFVHRIRVRQDETGGWTLTLGSGAFRKMSDSEDYIQAAPGSYSMVELMSFDGGVRYEYRIIHLAADPD